MNKIKELKKYIILIDKILPLQKILMMEIIIKRNQENYSIKIIILIFLEKYCFPIISRGI